MRMKAAFGVCLAAAAIVGFFSARTTAFNPQPDPPGFGLVTLVPGQGLRVNVVCSEHGVRNFPPDPCRGDLMVHDMVGNVLASRSVALRPGEAASLAFDVRDVAGPVGIDPCWVPNSANQGHAIPSAEVYNSETGRTTLFLNPAVARLSALAVSMSQAPLATDVR